MASAKLQPVLDHIDADFDQIANHRFDVAANVADLGKLARLHFEER